MSQITRRGFLGRLGGVLATAAAAAALPALAWPSATSHQLTDTARQALADSTRLPLTALDGRVFTPVHVSREDGISIRFVRQFDIAAAQHIQRFDVLYGVGYVNQSLACRVEA